MSVTPHAHVGNHSLACESVTDPVRVFRVGKDSVDAVGIPSL